MSETLVWWIALQVVGLAALPLCLLLFRWLPDRGYSLSKPFGLLLLGYVFWVINVPFDANTTATAWWVLIFIGAGAGYAYYRKREELLEFVRSHRWYILAVEGVLFLAFITGAWLRSFVPDISGTEKPMDFMFMNAMLRADGFPPADPWLSGWDVAYYYFGYLIVALMTRLSGVEAAIGFNLGLAMIAALAVTCATGLVYNLVAMRKRADDNGGQPPANGPPRVVWVGLAFGVTAGLLLTIMGNLEGVLEYLAAHNVGSQGFWNWIGIRDDATNGLAVQAYDSSTWYGDRFWSWWPATRMLDGGRGIHEFPFFSFLLGDMHPHVMSIPFVLLAVGGALALFRSEEPLDVVFWLTRPWWLAAFAIMLGALAFINTWDMPTLAVIIVLASLLRNRLLANKWTWGLGLDTLGFVLPLFLLAFIAYTPFFFGGFDSQASGFTAEAGTGTRQFHAFLIWGPFAVLVLPYAVWRLTRSGGREGITWSTIAWCFTPALAVFGLWAVWDILPEALGWLLGGPLHPNEAHLTLGDRLTERSTNWFTAIYIAGALALLVLALVREVASDRESAERRESHVFALALAAVAALLILGVEFIYIQDGFSSRMNTIFKLYYQAWLLLSIAGGFALYEIVRGLGSLRMPAGQPVESGSAPSTRSGQVWRAAWAGAAAVVLLGAFVYPLVATLNRTEGFDLPRRLDGLAYLSPGDRAAIDWLAEQGGRPVIAEAVGNDYTSAGRVAAATGLPSPLQWPGHENQWRGSGDPYAGRQELMDKLYTSTSDDEVRQALQQFGIRFVVLGPADRDVFAQKDPPMEVNLEQHTDLLEPAFPVDGFDEAETKVYRVKASLLSQVSEQP